MPTIIVAFLLITICLGAFVQVIDQSRQKRAAMKRDISALTDLLAERLDRLASVRQDHMANIERLQSLLPDLIPAWGVAGSRHVIITGADHRSSGPRPHREQPWRQRSRPGRHQHRATARPLPSGRASSTT